MQSQQTIEEKFDPKKVIHFSAETILSDACGPMEDWMMTLGEYQFLLEPSSGIWLFFDRVHDTWESTGYMAGEVTFTLMKGELVDRPNPEPTIWPRDRRYEAAEQLFQQFLFLYGEEKLDESALLKAVEALTLKDRQGRHWRIRAEDGVWTWWNGKAWVAGEPQRENLPVPNLGPWQKFAEAKWRYFELWNQKEAGKLSEEAFAAEINQLRVQDENQAWWQVRAEDGAWLAWDGSGWLEGQPAV